tara:strand:+ start:294 stop:1670 length:1377 start_codon:yes stop_codon:yes gene_type:complete
MTTYINDLKKLDDISEFIWQESIFNNKQNMNLTDIDIEDFKESMQYFIQDFIDSNIKLYKNKDFELVLYDALYNIIITTYDTIIDNIDFDLDYHIYDAMEIYFYRNNAFRSYYKTTIVQEPNKRKISRLLNSYQNMEQPEQRTVEWFKFRREGLSASNLYKCLDTQSNKNSIIYNKCKPLDLSKKDRTNINSACHNGVRYEPLSIMLYEYDNNTEIGEFGCIKHIKYPFLRASPDGINIKKSSKLYGRLVEVKNPTTRKLDGKPKKEYWVQMQCQMEVWDLEECDFLETVFKSYKNEEEFNNDGNSFIRNSKNQRKGIIVQFYDGKQPIYKYPPIDCTKEEFDIWYDNILEENSLLTWVTNIYWYLQDYSCVLVPRNKKWFRAVLPDLLDIWNIILKERETGYDHRKPKKQKAKKLTPTTLSKLEENTKKLFQNSNIDSSIDKNQNLVIKVNTETSDP